MGVHRQCLTNEEIQKLIQKQLHQYLVRDELEILNKRVFDSLIRSMKYDAKLIHTNPNKTVDFFDLFGEFMLYASCDSLFWHVFTTEQRNTTPNFYQLFQKFQKAFKLGILRLPFRTILFIKTKQWRIKFNSRTRTIIS